MRISLCENFFENIYNICQYVHMILQNDSTEKEITITYSYNDLHSTKLHAE